MRGPCAYRRRGAARPSRMRRGVRSCTRSESTVRSQSPFARRKAAVRPYYIENAMFGLVLLSGLGQVPEQIHLALTEAPGAMRVTWATMTPGDGDGHVVYWAEGTNRSAAGSAYTYDGDGFVGTLHTAVLEGLTTGTRYTYSVISAAGFVSRPLTFRYQREAAQISLLAYGDMGVKNSWGTVKLADADAASGVYDLFLNVGDTSYADDNGQHGHNGVIFDEHFRNIEGHAATMPFMSVAGNHESQYSFAPYIARLPMPKMQRATAAMAPFYFSFDYGPAHFVGYSSEHSLEAGSEQHNFLAADLAAAALPAARAARPWIVMFTHHPMYCSDGLLPLWESRCSAQFEIAASGGGGGSGGSGGGDGGGGGGAM